MPRRISAVTVVVPEYDDGISYFCGVLGFDLVEDTPLGGGKRWVVVRPGGEQGSALLLARAETERQRERIGDQAGGRVFLFLETDDFEADHARYAAAGVRFVERPRNEAYGTVAVFQDPFGNRWDLIGTSPRSATPGPG